MSKDLFSGHANVYAKYRPLYPGALIEHILEHVEGRDVAWDCATGNGQVASLLAAHFQRVEATDISENQLKHATPHAAIRYSISTAEQTPFDNDTFDLITVAQAYHWFDHVRFCREARRVSKAGAVVAVWAYEMFNTSNERLNRMFLHFYEHVVGPYWEPERKWVEERYETAFFDFDEIDVRRQFSIDVLWTMEQMAGYLESWSAVQQYIKVHGKSPVEELMSGIRELWTDSTIKITFPLFLRMGYVDK